MGALFSDWRKAAFCALALLVFAVMFTNQGGIGETAVTNAQELAARDRTQRPRAPAPAAKAWFAQDESEYEVDAAPPPRTAQGPAYTGGGRPGPTGADFPAGLRPPA